MIEMTKEEAIDRVGRAILSRQGAGIVNWQQSYPTVLDKAETVVLSLEALGLIKLK